MCNGLSGSAEDDAGEQHRYDPQHQFQSVHRTTLSCRTANPLQRPRPSAVSTFNTCPSTPTRCTEHVPDRTGRKMFMLTDAPRGGHCDAITYVPFGPRSRVQPYASRRAPRSSIQLKLTGACKEYRTVLRCSLAVVALLFRLCVAASGKVTTFWIADMGG